MATKPTYEELEQRVKELETEAVKPKQQEETLQKAEERFRTIYEESTIGIEIYDSEGKLLHVNKACLDIFGVVDEGQIKGFRLFDDPNIPDNKKTILRKGGMVRYESAFDFDLVKKHELYDTTKSGIAYHSVVITPLAPKGKDGSVEFLVQVQDNTEHKQVDEALQKAHNNLEQMVNKRTAELMKANEQLIQEIDDRKRAEEGLRDSEERYRSLFKNNHSVMLLIDPMSADIEDANPAAISYYGWGHEELTAKKITDINILTEEQIFQEMEKAKSEQRHHFIFQHRLSNGDIRDVEVYSGPIKLHGQNLLYSIIHDITDRKQAEEALKASEKRYRSLVDNIDFGVTMIDSDHNIVMTNVSQARMFNKPVYEFIGKKCFREYEKRENVCPHCPGVQAMSTGHTAHTETEGVRDDGSRFSVSINAFPILSEEGHPTGFIEVVEDVTERKKAEEEKRKLADQLRQAQKMEAVGTLAGGIAHDFNNLLGIILGNAELAMDDVPEWNPARFNLEEVKTASLRGKDVVRQLLSFTRKTDQERKPVKINPIVIGALKLLRSSIPTSIEIRSNIPRDSAIILADPTQINQIMINLCTNAAHAMEEDGGVIEVSLDGVTLDELMAQSYEISSGRYVKLTVNDTGHGIDSELKDRIFDPYFTTREVGKGSGMGLSVVHGIVKNHKGAITVDSGVGKGSTFNIFLPIVEREPVPEITIDEDLPTGKERILFVDDEESIVNMGRQRLERFGYKVESTTSPIEALDLFRSKSDQFDLVITDLTMPKMTGDKLVKGILNIRPDMPIIICTGFSEKMDEEKAKEIGATGYLEKPHEKRYLAKMVRKVLDGK